MIAGFAMVAYPAEYGKSGVMTFIVSHNGKVYEKDLGPNTARIGEKIHDLRSGPRLEQAIGRICTAGRPWEPRGILRQRRDLLCRRELQLEALVL